MISIAVDNILFSECLDLFDQPKTSQNLINNQTYADALRCKQNWVCSRQRSHEPPPANVDDQ